MTSLRVERRNQTDNGIEYLEFVREVTVEKDLILQLEIRQAAEAVLDVVQRDLRRGKYPDKKVAQKVAKVVHAVANELDA